MLETSRPFLRKWRREDITVLSELFADPEVMKYSDDGPRNGAQVSAWLQEQLKDIQGHEAFGYRAIELKATGQVIGYVSLSNAAARGETGDVELGIRLIRGAWRQGYATEAARRMIDLAFECENAMRVIGIVDPENVKSVRLLRKLGMTFEREVVFEGYDHPDHLYALDRKSATAHAR